MIIFLSEPILFVKNIAKDPMNRLHLKIVYDLPRFTILHHNRVYISNRDITIPIGRMQEDVIAVLHHK